jgi:TRAP-type mannitol/chloroaromatic compound transport system permease small subunit
MLFLLRISQAIDWVNAKFGVLANSMIVLACVVSAGNAMSRYAFDLSSNAWLEVQWYMFSVAVMLGASYTLQRNEHVRVDILYMQLSERGQLWVDIVGGLLFLLPACLLFMWLAWPIFWQSYLINEASNNAGGLLRWPVKALLPLGFALLALQGISEIVKRIGALQGYTVIDAKYERPQQ